MSVQLRMRIQLWIMNKNPITTNENPITNIHEGVSNLNLELHIYWKSLKSPKAYRRQVSLLVIAINWAIYYIISIRSDNRVNILKWSFIGIVFWLTISWLSLFYNIQWAKLKFLKHITWPVTSCHKRFELSQSIYFFDHESYFFCW